MATAAAAGGESMLWADFAAAPGTARAAKVNSIALAEQPGDVQAEPLAFADRMVRVAGRIGRVHGSRWSALGVEVLADAGAAPVDLSAFQSVRIRLGSDVPRDLRIRLKGPDPQVQGEGCYPVIFQRVAAMEQLDIPLAAFGPEPYCGARGVGVAQTLSAVVAVEVTLNEPADAPVRFDVGRIEFVKAQGSAAVAGTAAPAPAAGRGAVPKLVWAEEFNASSGSGLDDARWSVARVRGATAAHDGRGRLSVNAPFSMVARDDSAVLLPGRIEMRAQVPRGLELRASLRGAPLTTLPWPEDGEIVLLQAAGGDAQVGAFAPGMEVSHDLRTDGLHDGFHTFAVDWSAQQIRWQVDGDTVKTVELRDLAEPARSVFAHWPFVVRIDVAPGSDVPLLLDYVRVYQSDEQKAATRERLTGWRAARAKAVPAVAAASQAAPAPRPKPVRHVGAEPAEPPPTPSRIVKCERNRLGLMMCY